MKGLFFTYLMTYGGAALALFNPFYGLLVYVAFSILRPETMWFWSVTPGNYSRIVAIAMLAGWAIHGFGNWNLGRARPVVFCFLGLWCWAAVSALVAASNTPAALDWLEMIAKILLPFLVGVTTVNSFKQLRQLAWVIFLSQAYVALEMNLAYYNGWNRMQEGFGPMDNNVLSIAMVAGVGLGFFLALNSNKLWQKAVCLAGALLMAHSVMFAYSRGGMLALCVAGFVTFLIVPKRPLPVAAAIVALLIGYRLMGTEVTERFLMTFTDEEQRDDSAQSRLDMWKQCWTLMKENPVFGVGPDNWGDQARDRFGWPGRKEAHSLWMQTGAELGFPGLAMLLGFYGFCGARIWKYMKQRAVVADPAVRHYARMVVAGLAGFLIAASFVTVERLEMPYYLVMLGAATLRLQSLMAPQPALAPVQPQLRPHYLPVGWHPPTAPRQHTTS